MKITIESTDKIVTLISEAGADLSYDNEMPARIWEGTTESGIPIHCYVTRIAVKDTEDQTQFGLELQEHRPASAEVRAIPLRLII